MNKLTGNLTSKRIAAISSGFILMAVLLSASQGKTKRHPIKTDIYHEYDIKWDSVDGAVKIYHPYYQEIFDKEGKKVLHLIYADSNEYFPYGTLKSSSRFYYNDKGLLAENKVYNYKGADSTLNNVSRYYYNYKGILAHFIVYDYYGADSLLRQDAIYTYDSLGYKSTTAVNNQISIRSVKTSDGKRDSIVHIIAKSDTSHTVQNLPEPHSTPKHKTSSWDGDNNKNLVIQSYKSADGKHDSVVMMAFPIKDTVHDTKWAIIRTIPTPLRYNLNRKVYDKKGRLREAWIDFYRYGLWAVRKFNIKGRNVETDVYDNDSVLISKDFPQYNKHGDLTGIKSYHGDTLTSNQLHKYIYDKLGHILVDSSFNDKILYSIKRHQYEYY